MPRLSVILFVVFLTLSESAHTQSGSAGGNIKIDPRFLTAGPWPRITRADVEACRPVVAAYHRQWVNSANEDITEYCVKQPDPRNCQAVKKYREDLSRMDPVDWFIKGKHSCEGTDAPCFGISLYNEERTGPDRKEWIETFRDQAQAAFPGYSSPADLNVAGVEKCIAQTWISKLVGKGGTDMAQAQPPAVEGARVCEVRAGCAVYVNERLECSDTSAVPGAKWSGECRGGLLEGRGALWGNGGGYMGTYRAGRPVGHYYAYTPPGRKAAPPGSRYFIYDDNGKAIRGTADCEKNPDICREIEQSLGAPLTPSSIEAVASRGGAQTQTSSASATSSTRAATRPGVALNAAVSECVKPNTEGGDYYGGVKNVCPFAIAYVMCFENVQKDSTDTWAFHCDREGGLWAKSALAGSLGAGKIDRRGLPVGGRAHVFACKEPYSLEKARWEGGRIKADCVPPR